MKPSEGSVVSDVDVEPIQDLSAPNFWDLGRALQNGPVNAPQIRVAAYVLRYRRSWELLVFEQAGQPHAGSQIRAGGVHATETLEVAVLREVREETGLTGLRLRQRLVTEDKPHPVTGQPRRTTFFVMDADDETPDRWEHCVRGDDPDNGFVFVCRFASLPLAQSLADGQDAWLGQIDGRFATVGGRGIKG